jgi:hypothetical protein
LSFLEHCLRKPKASVKKTLNGVDLEEEIPKVVGDRSFELLTPAV